MDTDTILGVIAIICGVLGIIGVIIPGIPGSVLSWAGLFIAYFISYSEISTFMVVLWGIISLIVIVIDYVLPGYFTKKFGGTKAGMWGATIGVFASFALTAIIPFAILVGPFAGAVIGEIIGMKRKARLSPDAPKPSTKQAFKVGIGSLISFLVGTFLKLVTSCWMLYHIIVDVCKW